VITPSTPPAIASSPWESSHRCSALPIRIAVRPDLNLQFAWRAMYQTASPLS
jgi:hypothetical protein